MYITKLGRTDYTGEETRYPQQMGGYQTSNYHRSRASNPSFEQSQVSHRSRRIDYIAPGDRQVYTYCPICKKDYSNEQMEAHARIHDSSSSYRFNIDDDKRHNMTNDTIASSGLFTYPLVQPLEFYTSELNDSKKEDNFYFKDTKNYDKVDRNLFKSMSDSATQTPVRPPLQYESNNTDMFNCLDNIFNSGKGPKFSGKDIVGHNKFVTPKRHLQQWELIRKSERNVASKLKR